MARYGRRGQRLVEVSDKSMSRYSQHARQIAFEMTQFLGARAEEAGISVAEVRRYFEAASSGNIALYHASNCGMIAEFMARAPSRWPSYMRKELNDVDAFSSLWFIVMAIVACERAERILDLRDNFRHALAPGEGYRVTAAEMYQFGQELTEALHEKVFWPGQLFTDAGVADYDDEDEDDDDDDDEPVGMPALNDGVFRAADKRAVSGLMALV